MPSIRLLTGRVLREASCLTGSLERGHLTTVLSPPPQPFAFCPFHKLVSIRTPLDPKPDGRSESTVGRGTKEGRPPRHAFDSSMGPPYPERWIVWVFWFPVFKVSHSQLSQKKEKKKKGSTPHPSPTLSSEPSERKPRSHATRPVWLRLRFGASAQRFRQPGLLPGVPALLGSRKLSQCLYFQTWMPAPRPLSAFTSQGAPELKEKKMVPGAQLFRGRFS